MADFHAISGTVNSTGYDNSSGPGVINQISKPISASNRWNEVNPTTRIYAPLTATSTAFPAENAILSRTFYSPIYVHNIAAAKYQLISYTNQRVGEGRFNVNVIV